MSKAITDLPPDWNWRCSREWPAEVWHAADAGHQIEARGYSGRWVAFEDDVQIINHNTGKPMCFETLGAIRRWFNDQREIQTQLSQRIKPMTDVDTVERVARGIWPEIGSDYTWTEALDRASGKITDDEHSQIHHRQATEYARDLARAAIAALPPAVPEQVIGYASVYRDDEGDFDIGSTDLFKNADGTGDMGGKGMAAQFADYVGWAKVTLIEGPDGKPLTATPDPAAEARAKAVDDAKWYGAGFMRVLSDGTWDHIDHECISIHAPLDPNPPETDPAAEAAKVLLDLNQEDRFKVRRGMKDYKETHGYSYWTSFEAALRALTKDGEAG